MSTKLAQMLAAKKAAVVVQEPDQKQARYAAFFVSVMEEIPNVPAEKVTARIKALQENWKRVAELLKLDASSGSELILQAIESLWQGREDLAARLFQTQQEVGRLQVELGDAQRTVVSLQSAKPAAPADKTGVTFTAGDVERMMQEIVDKLHEGMPAATVARLIEGNIAQLRGLPELKEHVEEFIAGAARIFETVKQLVECPHCARPNHPDAKTCEHCGKPMNIPKFLGNRGAPVTPTPAPIAPQHLVAPSKPAPPAVVIPRPTLSTAPKTVACPKCGAGNKTGTKFCIACGHELSLPAPVGPSPVLPKPIVAPTTAVPANTPTAPPAPAGTGKKPLFVH